ncbi:MAG TPA: UbiD family decarboxylase [Pirellulales bacterium]|nr:UbiD family decarboxylase [Pirellulales bacterium]
MPVNSLADFLEELERAGELARVSVEVDPDLEAAAITDRVAKSGGPALFFERLKGHYPPLVTNLLGAEPRLCRALGVAKLDELADRLTPEVAPAAGWLERLKAGSLFAAPAKEPTKTVRSGVCQQVVKLGRDVDLAEWPALRCWPLEPRRSITSGLLLTQDPETGVRKFEAVALEIVDRAKLAVCWGRYDAGLRHWAAYRRRGERMPVAAWIGADPALAVVAAAPLPGEADSFAFAALLRRQPMELVKCRSHELEVPAEAEIVIEGFVDPEEQLATSGPHGQADGRYGPQREAWPLAVTTVTHRTNPVFAATVPAGPPNESDVIARAIERLWLPLVKQAVPELVDYALIEQAGPHNLAVLSIRKTFPGQARKAAGGFWGLDAYMFVKRVVVVDADVDVRDYPQVLLAAATNAAPGRDVFFQAGPPHPADAQTAAGSQLMGLDATTKLPNEHAGSWPEKLALSQETVDLIRARWSEYGLRFASHPSFGDDK